MTRPEDIESRLSAVEREVARLRLQQSATAADSAAARVLASGADHDVSAVRAELHAHLSALNALRESQLEGFTRVDTRMDRLGERVDRLETRMEQGFAMVGAGLTQIVTLVEGLDR